MCCNLTHQTCGNKSWTEMASVWKHVTSKIATDSERERKKERKKESGKSTDGPSYNTSVPIELSEKMNNDDMEKTIKYCTK